MPQWWVWWLKWWVWAGAGVFIVLLFSQPPQLWFWLVVFVVIVLYGFERSLNLLAQKRESIKSQGQTDHTLFRK